MVDDEAADLAAHHQTDVVVQEPFPEEASERTRRRKRTKPSQRTVWEAWDGVRWSDI